MDCMFHRVEESRSRVDIMGNVPSSLSKGTSFDNPRQLKEALQRAHEGKNCCRESNAVRGGTAWPGGVKKHRRACFHQVAENARVSEHNKKNPLNKISKRSVCTGKIDLELKPNQSETSGVEEGGAGIPRVVPSQLGGAENVRGPGGRYRAPAPVATPPPREHYRVSDRAE